MPLTPEQIAKIRKKEAETPDALKRNPLNDYTEGWTKCIVIRDKCT